MNGRADRLPYRPAPVRAGDLYLDAEERYEVLVVKAAERPHLLRWSAADDDDDDDDEKKAADGAPPPPLTDGCDLPGWRRRRIAPCMNSPGGGAVDVVESPFGGTLHVGAGSTLLRRETQFPFVTSALCGGAGCRRGNDASRDYGAREEDGCCWWRAAKRRLGVPPPADRAAPVIDRVDAARSVDHRAERSGASGVEGVVQISMFCREYEVKNRPVKITGLAEGWSAMPRYYDAEDPSKRDVEIDKNERRGVGETTTSELFSGGGEGGWTFANLLSRFGDVHFRFSDEHGEMMSLRTYAKYVTCPEGLADDAPLGIYDSELGDDDSPTRVLLDEYAAPGCFGPDLFDLADDGAADATDGRTGECGSAESDGETNRTATVPLADDDATADAADEGTAERRSVESDEETNRTATVPRPPYRWILIGPERSGTGMHVDPLWTDAWVTVLQGRKRWLLFPPDTPPAAIGMIDGRPQIPSSIWFRDFYDAVTSPSWPEEHRPTEVLQRPGETVYVPAGWPHLVLNLELTVAVTHNYASGHGPHLGRTWEEAARDAPRFAKALYAGLRRRGREDLAGAAPPEVARDARTEGGGVTDRLADVDDIVESDLRGDGVDDIVESDLRGDGVDDLDD